MKSLVVRLMSTKFLLLTFLLFFLPEKTFADSNCLKDQIDAAQALITSAAQAQEETRLHFNHNCANTANWCRNTENNNFTVTDNEIPEYTFDDQGNVVKNDCDGFQCVKIAVFILKLTSPMGITSDPWSSSRDSNIENSCTTDCITYRTKEHFIVVEKDVIQKLKDSAATLCTDPCYGLKDDATTGSFALSKCQCTKKGSLWSWDPLKDPQCMACRDKVGTGIEFTKCQCAANGGTWLDTVTPAVCYSGQACSGKVGKDLEKCICSEKQMTWSDAKNKCDDGVEADPCVDLTDRAKDQCVCENSGSKWNSYKNICVTTAEEQQEGAPDTAASDSSTIAGSASTTDSASGNKSKAIDAKNPNAGSGGLFGIFSNKKGNSDGSGSWYGNLMDNLGIGGKGGASSGSTKSRVLSGSPQQDAVSKKVFDINKKDVDIFEIIRGEYQKRQLAGLFAGADAVSTVPKKEVPKKLGKSPVIYK